MKSIITITFLLFMTLLPLEAVEKQQMIGHWNTITTSNDNGQRTVEKEYLNLNGDSSFDITILVSVQKGNAYIKDLRIEATGIWEVRDNTLVLVVKTVSVPRVQKINQISQQSLNQLADNFKYKYENDPIHIITIKFLNQNSLVTINEAFRETSYSR